MSVLDLASARPNPRPRASASASAAGEPASPRSPRASADAVCAATALDPDLFSSRPGLRVLQLGWHPASEGHLAVLTSGETLDAM